MTEQAVQLVFNRDGADTIGACMETVNALAELLRLARQGRVTGMAVAVLYDDNHYSPRVTGDARINPTFARGMVRTLDDLLADYVRGHV